MWVVRGGPCGTYKNAYADWFIYVIKDEKQFLIQQSKRMLFRSLDCLHARTADSRLTVIQCSSTVVKSPLCSSILRDLG